MLSCRLGIRGRQGCRLQWQAQHKNGLKRLTGKIFKLVFSNASLAIKTYLRKKFQSAALTCICAADWASGAGKGAGCSGSPSTRTRPQAPAGQKG